MNEPTRYNFREAEAKWQKLWAEQGSFAAKEDPSRPKYYVLEMFPYPSGNIHMGHVRNYTLGDVVARTKRAQGYNVLHPMGWDAFGLPAENAAIQNNSHPADWTLQNIATMREQLKLIGLSYDWSREIATCTPDYYKHEQAFFIKFLTAGLAYRKEAEVNWDPIDNTVLANEQVIDGRGWRSGALVERRKLSQWFLRISDFAEELLAGLDGLKEWPEKVRIMQERWIGKSQGALVTLTVLCKKPGKEPIESSIEIYTTRPDTFFGMSFVAIAAEHPLAQDIGAHNPEAAEFLKECSQIGTTEAAIETAEKKGFDTGLKAINPFTGTEHPLYIANFVLMGYGTGAVFGCPAHDERDFEFAKKYNLPILPVVAGGAEPLTEAYTGDGVMINSDFLNGMDVPAAKKRVLAALEAIGCGTAKTNYRLRDWGVSRQRYWGCPIPIIHCESCGAVPVPQEQLPVELPKDVKFDKPGNPLDHHPTWKHTSCPICKKAALRETDTFDTFFESSWYFSRFASMPSDEPLHAASVNYWLPVDCYIGGIEHAVLHLLYSRFFTRALKKCDQIGIEEPFKRLETQGMICHETYKDIEGKWLYPEEVTFDFPEGEIVNLKDNTRLCYERSNGRRVAIGRSEKMSKSKKNTVDPRAMMMTYGADAARLFMLSDSPPERDLEWTDAGIEGAWRYLNRLWRLVQVCTPTDENEIKKLTHKTIAAVTDDIEKFHFNKAIARIRELTNVLEKTPVRESVEVVLHLLQPFLPHITEECWAELGNKDMLINRPWPVADKAFLVDDAVTIAVQINGKLKTTIELPKDLPKEEAEARVMALPQVSDAVAGNQVKKIIVVPNRIVNIVAV